MKTITIWSDYACPYCYIGEKRLKDAIKELGAGDEIRIEYRAFELDPTAPRKVTGNTVDRLAVKYSISIEEAKKRVKNIDELGKEIGLNIKFGSAKYVNTFDAHRLMKFVETQYEPTVVEAFNDALFDAYFTHNHVLTDFELLTKIAADCGVDPNQAREVLESDLYANDVRYDEKEAQMRGVHGVPYMVFDGEFAVPGAISTEDCKKVVLEMLSRKKEKPEGLHGKSCDETGCTV